MTITLNLQPTVDLTDQQFEQICRNNRDLRFERTAKRELVIMAPTGGESGSQNANLTTQVWLWNRQARLGSTFDSSTGFNLPNGATRAPDVAWVALERWQALSREQQRKFVPLCPDFAIELRSPSDELAHLQSKMREYVENGLRLGWLIDPEERRVHIYRSEGAIEVLDNPQTLSGEEILPGFVLDLSDIFLS
jgi:Uma2 family endonuclease